MSNVSLATEVPIPTLELLVLALNTVPPVPTCKVALVVTPAWIYPLEGPIRS